MKKLYPLLEEDTVFSLMHNGTVNKDLLLNLITDSGTDSSWIETHPPQTFGGGHWNEGGWESVVDSELILLHVMKKINLQIYFFHYMEKN